MYFIQKNTFRKRVATIGLLTGAYLGGLWIFHSYTPLYGQYQSYYLLSEARALGYTLSHFRSQTASVFFSSGENHSGEVNKFALSVPVLLYHGILKKSDGVNVDLNTFEDQMFTLKEAGYSTVGAEDLYQFLLGKKQLPEKSFVLTSC